MSVEVIEGLKRRMHVQVPAVEIESEISKRIDQLSKKVKMDGFRPGKAPRKAVEQRYRAGVREEVIAELMRKNLFEKIQSESLDVAGTPVVETITANEGEPMSFVATFEVFPEFTVKDLGNQKVEKTVAEVSTADIEGMIEKLRKQHVDWAPVERAAANDDQVEIDFAGSIDGKLFDGGTAKNFKLVLGAGQMIPGFEDQLIGLKKGEERTIKVKFPDNYHAAQFAGKDAEFAITAHTVFEPKLPELNDAFLQRFNIKGGVEEFRRQIETSMKRELQQRVSNENKTVVFDKLLETNQIPVPEALIKQEIDSMRKQMQQSMQQRTGSKESFNMPDNLFEEPAKRRVALGLLLNELIKTNEIKADADSVKAAIEEIAQNYDNPDEVVRWYYSDKQRLANIEATVVENLLVDKLFASASVTELKKTYEDLMDKQQHHHHTHDEHCGEECAG